MRQVSSRDVRGLTLAVKEDQGLEFTVKGYTFRIIVTDIWSSRTKITVIADKSTVQVSRVEVINEAKSMDPKCSLRALGKS